MSLTCGWGINDADYVVQPTIEGRRRYCPVYRDWKAMVERCNSSQYLIKYPTYRDVTVCEEWKYFSNFRKWVLEEQPNKDWQNCVLDKDILGGSVYSATSCVYVTKTLNGFITDRKRFRGTRYIGVMQERYGKYLAYINNPFTKSRVNLGSYFSELEAHKAWQAKKHEYACLLAEQQQDPRVAKALRERYAPDKDWTNK